MRRPRVPRNKITANTGGEETVFRSQYVNQTASTGSTSQAYGIIAVCPPYHSASDDPGATIAANYQEYVCTSHGIKYTPSVGTTTSGTMWVAFVDNPEIIYKFYAGTYAYADYLKIAQTTRHSKSAPVWEPLEFSVSTPTRRKLFSVDTSSLTTIEQTDRVVQGAYIYASTSAPTGTTLGVMTDHYTCRVKGLQSRFATGV